MRDDRSRIARLFGIIAACIGIGSGFGSGGMARGNDDPAPPPVLDPVILKLVEGHNKERAAEGLPPLTLEGHLVEAAKVHARDMAEHEVMTHDGSDGSAPNERVVKAGYHYRATGENVAEGYRTVPEVMRGWMESPPHRKNILADFTQIGLAVAYSETGKPYWCAEFGKPMPKLEPARASADLVERINQERKAAKLPELAVDPALSKAAEAQAVKLSKVRTPGSVAVNFDGIDQKAYRDLAVSTAAGHPDAETMVQTLIEKPSHKDQILGKFTRIGAGYAAADDGTPHWCLILATPSRR